MIPSDHFVRFYNEVFKFLDERNGLRSYYDEISRHQEFHCLENFRKNGLRGMYEYWEHIRVEENCEVEQKLLPDRLCFHMTRCPSLSKVLDCDAEPCRKYCEHCAGWVLPLLTKCGYYCVENIVGRTVPECWMFITPDRKVAEELFRQHKAMEKEPDTVLSNLDRGEEIERNRNQA